MVITSINYFRLLVILLLFIPIAQAQNEFDRQDSWTTVDDCGVTFQVPSDVNSISEFGIDSCVRHFRSDNISILLDVSPGNSFQFRWNDELKNKLLSDVKREYGEKPDFQLAETEIDNNDALIYSFYDDDVGEVSNEDTRMHYVAVLKVREMSITIRSKTSEGQTEAQRIFESVKIAPLPQKIRKD